MEVNTVTLLRSWFCPPGTCVQTSSTHKVVRGLISDVRAPDFVFSLRNGHKEVPDIHGSTS